MENLTQVATLLGEENEKRLKDGITDLLLKQVEMDLEDKYQSYYILDFDELFDEIKRDIQSIVKEKVMEKYMESIDGLIKERF